MNNDLKEYQGKTVLYRYHLPHKQVIGKIVGYNTEGKLLFQPDGLDSKCIICRLPESFKVM